MADLTKRTAKSPYQKKGKRPYRYSAELQRWRSAAVERRGDRDALAKAHDRYIERTYGPMPGPKPDEVRRRERHARPTAE